MQGLPLMTTCPFLRSAEHCMLLVPCIRQLIEAAVAFFLAPWRNLREGERGSGGGALQVDSQEWLLVGRHAVDMQSGAKFERTSKVSCSPSDL